MFKGIANLAQVFRQAQQLGGRMQELQQQLQQQRAQGTAGGGLVEAEVNGLGELVRLKIDPTLVERGEREMIEDLVPAAVNQALANARQLLAQATQSLSQGLDVPGLRDALAQWTGGAGPSP